MAYRKKESTTVRPNTKLDGKISLEAVKNLLLKQKTGNLNRTQYRKDNGIKTSNIVVRSGLVENSLNSSPEKTLDLNFSKEAANLSESRDQRSNNVKGSELIRDLLSISYYSKLH